MKNCLSNRKQFTVMNGRKSSNTPVRCGVPQGSVLGPSLFTLLANDLPLSITSGDAFMYADDAKVFCIDSTQGAACDLLNVALKEIFTWCINKRLTPHPSKFEVNVTLQSSAYGPAARHLYWRVYRTTQGQDPTSGCHRRSKSELNTSSARCR